MSNPTLSPAASEDFARRCHAANVTRWIFYQLPKPEIDRVLNLAEKANALYRAHKAARQENQDNGWWDDHVTPWQRDRNSYILIPVPLLIVTGCMDEAEATWLGDIRVREVSLLKNKRAMEVA